MNILANARIGVRLGLAFGVLTLLLLGCAAFGALRLSALNDAMSSMVDESVRPAVLAAQLESQSHELGSALRDAVLTDARAEIQAQLKRVAELRQLGDATQKELQEAIHSENGRQALQAVTAAQPAYMTAMDGASAAIKSGDTDDARSRMVGAELRSARTAYVGALQKLVAAERTSMDEAKSDAQTTYSRSRNLLFAVVLAAAVLAGVIAGWVTRSITRPIREAVRIAETVSTGDLSSRIEAHSKDETGQLLAALVRMNSSLARVVARVRAGSEAIATGSVRIAEGSTDLSQRTEQQASSLEETSASMEELSTTVRENAETAREAANLASSATEVAKRGGQKVNEVVGTMEAITASSRKISEIIGVIDGIDGIAFQTNILALNAAVEAARAGEQGRGFAVVAGEVRTLAQRSAAAAKEIKALINDSVAKVEAGSDQVSDAGRTMDDIVAQTQRVNELIARISSATAEQTAGIGQVGDTVLQLDKVTQQNASLVEESAEAAELLKRQAAELVDAVGVFKLNEDDAVPRSSAKDDPAAATRGAPVTATVHSLSVAPVRAEPERMAS